jgi:hypothetical protein
MSNNEKTYWGPSCVCIYLAPWLDVVLFRWYFLGVGAALFAVWMVKPSLRWLAALAWGLVGWSRFCYWRNWHPLPGDLMVAFIGYGFCMWAHAYIEGQDRLKPPEPKEEF